MQEVFRLRLSRPLPKAVVAFGGDLKCALAAGAGRDVAIFEPFGDLADPDTQDRLEAEAQRLVERAGPRAVLVCDKHPGYFSRRLCLRLAAEGGHTAIQVQHHRAHIAAVAAERGLLGQPVVAMAFDGTGYGDDGGIWGGEFFAGNPAGALERRASFAPLTLCGGDAAVREPWRIALACLLENGADAASIQAWLKLVGEGERDASLFAAALSRGVNCVRTTSLGRWFDCFAALWGVRTRADFEGHAAIELQKTAEKAQHGCFLGPADIAWMGEDLAVIRFDELLETFDYMLADWGPRHAALWARQFHASVAEAAALVAARLAQALGTETVVSGGGCFLNSLLCGMLDNHLERHGLKRVGPRSLPPGDAAIALGQIVLASGAHRSVSSFSQV